MWIGQPREGLPLHNKKLSILSVTAPGQKNVAYSALGYKSKIFLAPLYMKLDLITTSVKAMDKNAKGLPI